MTGDLSMIHRLFKGFDIPALIPYVNGILQDYGSWGVIVHFLDNYTGNCRPIPCFYQNVLNKAYFPSIYLDRIIISPLKVLKSISGPPPLIFPLTHWSISTL